MVPEPSSCDLCMHTTWAGNVVSRTLLFRTYYSCAGSVIGSCTHNHTTYLVCSHGNQHICFNPTYRPWEQWLEIQSICNHGNLVCHTQVFRPDKPVSMLFDACAAIDQDGYGGISCSCGGLMWETAYTSIHAGETTRGHVMMCVLIIDFIGVVFHGLHGKGQNTQPSCIREQLPQTALLVPVIL
jgi:hypothetical protein